MTEKQFDIILGVLADKLKDQSELIGYKDLRIDLLTQKLEEAEKHIKGE